MARKIQISQRKQAQQKRSEETISLITTAAAYILRKNGPQGFTARKVSEKAGVNIASFYQYFPNKEALLFRLAKMEWEASSSRLWPILSKKGPDHAIRFKHFVREFFFAEASESDLRKALRVASVGLNETPEYKNLISSANRVFSDFILDALGGKPSEDLRFNVEFIITLITSFAERTTDQRTTRAELEMQADVLGEMITSFFKIR